MKNSPKNFYNVVDKKKLGIDEAIAVASEVAELKNDVSQLENVVEDPDTGLVKTVADLKEVVDNIDYDISRKADIDGTYPDMTVGNADQLNSTQMITDKVPYVFRTSGGSNDIGNRENDKLVGGTLAFNQLLQIPGTDQSKTTDGVTITDNRDGSYTVSTDANGATNNVYILTNQLQLIEGHVYLLRGIAGGSASTYYSYVSGFNGLTTPKDYGDGVVSKQISSGLGSPVPVYVKSGTVITTPVTVYPNFYDLTQMFGSSVADQILTLEQAQSGSGVALFHKLFPKDYYAYNAGQLMSVKAIAHEMVGFNAYDHATGTAKLLGGNEYQITGTYTAIAYEDINGNAEIITPDASGIFTPTNNGIMTVTGGNDTDTCIHLTWSGYRNGEFEPYIKRSYILDQDLELRGVAKVDGNGNIYYDGDIYSSDGTVIRNYEIRAYASGDESLPNAITDGTNTVVKLDTPVEESADPFQDPQWVDDFGTEEYVDTREIKIPVGHITQYPANLRDKLQHLPSPTGVDGDYIIREDTEVMTLVPAPTGVPELPSVDGTYVLTCTVSDGITTLEWTSNA